MYSKKINQLATNLNPQNTDLIPIGDPTTGQLKTITYNQLIQSGGVPTSRTLTINGTTYDLSANRTWTVGTVTSVGLSMPSAFTVSNTPVTGSGTLTVTAAGTASQYIRGDGQLADFPQGGSGGGASVNYYLNGSVSQGTFGGSTYYEMNKSPVIGGGTNFTINADGYIASFLTDANDPNLLLIPGGNWNFELKLSASSGGGTPSFYLELYKYDGSTFTLIASSSTSPETITGGTSIDTYYTTIAVPETVLSATDRLAIRIYVTHQSRTITLYTEDNKLAQVITTFTTGLNALNGLTKQVQYFATGTSGTDFNISSSNDTHTFNFPTASATNRGLLSSSNWSTFNSKQDAITLTTTGTSGAATLVGSTLNIPQYQSVLTNPVTGTGTTNEIAYWTSSSAIGSLTTTTYPSLTELSYVKGVTSAIQTQLDGKQGTITLTTTGSSGAATLVGNTLNIPQYSSGMAIGNTITSATSGSVLFAGTSGVLAQDNSNFFWDDSNNRLGIGTNTPSTTLNVVGAGSFTGNILGAYLQSDGLTDNGMLIFKQSNTGTNVWDGTLLKTSIAPYNNTGLSIIVNQGAGINNYKGVILDVSLLTSTSVRTFKFPDTDGTLALTSNTQATITLTTTGNSGSATFISNTLNIPTYTLAGLGGFANPMTTLGDTVYGGASGTVTRLAGNTTTTKQFLSQTGTGSASAAPTWSSIAGSDITGAALTETDDTNVTMTLGGTPSTALLRSVSMTLGWTGQLAVSRGGTGLSALGSSLQVLRVNSAGTALEYATISAGGMSIGGSITSATAGSVLFAGTSGVLAQNNANFFWDNTNSRLGIGTATPAYKIDVNGTSRFSDALLVSKNANDGTLITISNTTSGTSSQSYIALITDATAGSASIGKRSNTFTASGIINLADMYLFNGTKGDIAIVNNFASGTIKFAAGGSSTSHVTIGTTGLTTFATGVDYKRLNPTTTTTASTATLTPDISAGDTFTITAQAAALSVANPTGTPVNGQKMIIRIKDNGTARAITWSGTQYRASSDLALPTTTVINKTMYLGFIWNSTDSKWDLLAFLNNF